MRHPPRLNSFFFFFNDTATTEIYTLSLHDALPICANDEGVGIEQVQPGEHGESLDERAEREPMPPLAQHRPAEPRDRKSTRLNSSHSQISYAVFCLKKKKNEVMQAT